MWGKGLPATQDHMVFWGGRQAFQHTWAAEKPTAHQGLWGKAVTQSYFHNWVVRRQTAVFRKGKLSQLAFQVLSCKWLSGGTIVSDCSPGLCLSEKSPLCSPPAPIRSRLTKEEGDHPGDKKTHIQHG